MNCLTIIQLRKTTIDSNSICLVHEGIGSEFRAAYKLFKTSLLLYGDEEWAVEDLLKAAEAWGGRHCSICESKRTGCVKVFLFVGNYEPHLHRSVSSSNISSGVPILFFFTNTKAPCNQSLSLSVKKEGEERK